MKKSILFRLTPYAIAVTLAQLLQFNQLFRFPHTNLEIPQQPEAYQQRNKPNESLVIILGNIRGGEPAWESLYQNLLDPNMADLALMVGEVAPKKHNSSLYKRAKYVWEFPEYTDWGDAIDLIGPSHDGNFTWRDLARRQSNRSSVFGPAKPSKTGSGAINYMARWFVSNKIKELSLLNYYTRFVITRSDHYYLCQHKKFDNLDPQFVWLPVKEDYGGFEDRYMVLSKQNVLQALDIFPPIVKHPKKYESNFTIRLNPEQVTKVVWTESGLAEKVRRMPRSMFLVAQPTDTTRWSKPTLCFESPSHLNGTGIKYPKELYVSAIFCQRQGSPFNHSIVNCSKKSL